MVSRSRWRVDGLNKFNEENGRNKNGRVKEF